MSDDVKHPLDDLVGTEEDDVSTDGESTTEDSSTGDDSNDQIGNLTSEVEKAKMVKRWADKVANDPKEMDNLKGKQAWLVPLVEKELELKKPPTDKAEMTRVAQEEARKILQEETLRKQQETEEKNFQDLKKTLKNLPKTKEQNAKLLQKFDEYAPKLGSYEALKLAAEYARIDFETDIEERKQSMPSFKQGDDYREKDYAKMDVSKVDVNDLSKEERYKIVAAKKRR